MHVLTCQLAGLLSDQVPVVDRKASAGLELVLHLECSRVVPGQLQGVYDVIEGLGEGVTTLCACADHSTTAQEAGSSCHPLMLQAE